MSLLRKLSLLVVDLQKMLTNKMGSPQQRAKKTFRAYDITPVVGSSASSSEMMHPDIMQVVRVIGVISPKPRNLFVGIGFC